MTVFLFKQKGLSMSIQDIVPNKITEWFNKNKPLSWLIIGIFTLTLFMLALNPVNTNPNHWDKTKKAEMENAFFLAMRGVSPTVISECTQAINNKELKSMFKGLDKEFKEGMYANCMKVATNSEKHQCRCLKKNLKYYLDENHKNLGLCSMTLLQGYGNYQAALMVLVALQIPAFSHCGLEDNYSRVLQEQTY